MRRALMNVLLTIFLLGLAQMAIADPPPATLVATQPATQSLITVTLPSTTLPSSPGYHPISITVSAAGRKFSMAVGLFIPPLYFKTHDPFPVVVSLHNNGFMGADGGGIPFEGMASLWVKDSQDERDPTTKPAGAIVLRKAARFIGIAPGMPQDSSFDAAPMPQIIAELVRAVARAYHADEQRIYLTGFSYGGSCTWRIAEQTPLLWAAIIPLSGRPTDNPARTIETLKNVAIYLACGTNEWALPECRKMHDALEAGKHPNFKYHEIPGGTHWCYGTTYTDPKFWDWLFAQKRKTLAAMPPVTIPATINH